MATDPPTLEWKYIKVRREVPVDSANWRECMFVTSDMYEATLRVLVPKGEKGTKRLAKREARGVN